MVPDSASCNRDCNPSMAVWLSECIVTSQCFRETSNAINMADSSALVKKGYQEDKLAYIDSFFASSSGM